MPGVVRARRHRHTDIGIHAFLLSTVAVLFMRTYVVRFFWRKHPCFSSDRQGVAHATLSSFLTSTPMPWP
jgi:hypothetical protein